VAGIRHHLEQRAVERQRAFELRKLGDIGLAQQLGRVTIITLVIPLGIGGVDAIDVLDDGEAGGAERIRDQEGAGIGTVRRNPRGRKFVVMIGRKRAALSLSAGPSAGPDRPISSD
jgi:hypothetical protein